MRLVRFVRGYRMYQPGETAGFLDAEAQALIDKGLAVDAAALVEARTATPDAAPEPEAETVPEPVAETVPEPVAEKAAIKTKAKPEK